MELVGLFSVADSCLHSSNKLSGGDVTYLELGAQCLEVLGQRTLTFFPRSSQVYDLGVSPVPVG